MNQTRTHILHIDQAVLPGFNFRVDIDDGGWLGIGPKRTFRGLLDPHKSLCCIFKIYG